MPTFVTAMRGVSGAVFAPGQVCEVDLAVPPCRLRLATRWDDDGGPEPGPLLVEARGPAAGLDAAVLLHERVGRLAAAVLAFAANAAVEPLEVVLAFDATPGARERSFRQVLTHDGPRRAAEGRRVPTAAFAGVFRAVTGGRVEPGVQRALFHYDHALRARASARHEALAHLWMAGEALVDPVLRRFAAGRDARDVARSVGIEVDRPAKGSPRPRWKPVLREWALRELVLQGDDDAYRAVRATADGFEYGPLGFDDTDPHAVAPTDRVFALVRTAALDEVDVDGAARDWLDGNDPLALVARRTVVRGALTGDVADPDALAATGRTYPAVAPAGTGGGDGPAGGPAAHLVPVVAEGVQVRVVSVEERGSVRPAPGASVGAPAGAPPAGAPPAAGPLPATAPGAAEHDSATGPAAAAEHEPAAAPGAAADHEPAGEPAGEAVDAPAADAGPMPAPARHLLDAAGFVAREHLADVTTRDWVELAALGLLTHAVALFEAAADLLGRRRNREALEIGAALFEQSVVAEWVADTPDGVAARLAEWMRWSLDDLREWSSVARAAGWSAPSDADVLAHRDALESLAPGPAAVAWPVTGEWLEARARGTDRTRAWMFWRIARHLRASSTGFTGRLVPDPGDGPPFRTVEADDAPIEETAAFVAEALLRTRRVLAPVLDLKDPEGLEDLLDLASARLAGTGT